MTAGDEVKALNASLPNKMNLKSKSCSKGAILYWKGLA
jgi:hypothetical protein